MAKKKSGTGTSERRHISDGVGASDDSSGGGNATGIPDADTGMRAEDAVTRGNAKEDRKKLFPKGSKEGASEK